MILLFFLIVLLVLTARMLEFPKTQLAVQKALIAKLEKLSTQCVQSEPIKT